MADIFNFTDLWTVGGTTYDAIKVDVTDTASAAASLLLNLSVGGSAKFSVRKDGHVVAATEAIGGATLGTNALAVAGATLLTGKLSVGGAGVTYGSSTFLGDFVTANGTAAIIEIAQNSQVGWRFGIAASVKNFRFDATSDALAAAIVEIREASGGLPGIFVGSAGLYGWSNSTAASATLDTTLSRQAAGVTQFGAGGATASGAWLAAKGTLTGGTLADQANVLAITAAQPTTPTGTQKAITSVITGAGSASQVNVGVDHLYGAGYTGSSIATGMRLANATAGTVGNGLFVVMADTAASVAGALVVDNSDKAVPIFLGRDNGSTVFTIADGGAVTATGITSITNTADASAVTGSGSLQVAGGASIAKRLWIPAITASAGLQTAVLCQSSGGEMIADSVACLASSARFKTILGAAEVGAIDKIIRVPIHRWKYKEEGIFQSATWTREHIGPTAEEIEEIDSRLVGYDNEGNARNISQEQLLALAIQAIQEQQMQIEDLKARPWAH